MSESPDGIPGAPDGAPAIAVEEREPHAERRRVRLPERAVMAPPECACCGELATERISVSDRTGRALLVGYCAPCAAHVAQASTRRLAALLASILLSGALAAAVPLIAPFWSLAACVAVTLLGGLLPLFPLLVFRKPSVGHASRGPAVVFSGPAELTCANGAWAEALGRLAGVGAEAAPPDRFRFGLLVAPALLGALLGAPLSFMHHHPRVRVVNANDRAIDFRVDGRSVGRVEPSGSESPSAGLTVRIPAGRRELAAFDPVSGPIAAARANVLPGRDHLYAPAAPHVCFWLETATYGRAGERPSRVLLGGDARFWAIPAEVRGWFVPNPPPDGVARTTGGTSTVLRQGPCDETPLGP
jgi:hypothetical protein